jgi:hypothetical protein
VVRPFDAPPCRDLDYSGPTVAYGIGTVMVRTFEVPLVADVESRSEADVQSYSLRR